MEPEAGRLFVDTWGWLVLEDRKHPAHAKVRELRQRDADRAGLWVTSDYVLDETITRLFSRRPFAEAERFCAGLFDARDSGLLRIESITPERFRKAYSLRLRYRDRPRISFTDLTSFVLMKELAIRDVLTEDQHFTQAQLGFHAAP